MSSEDVLRALEQSKLAVGRDRVETGLVRLLDEVEDKIGRALATDELQSAGRALRAGQTPEVVADMFRVRAPDVPDSAVEVHAAVLTSTRGGGTFAEVAPTRKES